MCSGLTRDYTDSAFCSLASPFPQAREHLGDDMNSVMCTCRHALLLERKKAVACRVDYIVIGLDAAAEPAFGLCPFHPAPAAGPAHRASTVAIIPRRLCWVKGCCDFLRCNTKKPGFWRKHGFYSDDGAPRDDIPYPY